MMKPNAALKRFLEALATRLRAARSEACARFAAELDGLSAIRSTPLPTPRIPVPALPVLRHWPKAVAGASAIDPVLGQALSDLYPGFVWRQNPNYVRRPPSPEFLEGYGYAVIAGPNGMITSGIALGVLVLKPGLLYPAHVHPAEEIYLVLDPASAWWREGEDWRKGLDGALVHHPPNVEHAMEAGAAPLCALYLWRGDLITHAALAPQAERRSARCTE
ncbi:MAG TPA: dimethylsulfonioproprionate lyase family protein [Alphaproteobacteria bacterium]|nr:dimethylsulfonioproprionate lyase family protein [Alphaproteobacteria bacterium]